LVPSAWDKAIHEGLSQTHKFGETPSTRDERIDTIVKQVCHFNPFLKGYIEPTELRIRTVFNPVSETNPDGMDRRVRRLLTPTVLSEDGQVLGAISPKWTTLELAALNLIDSTLQKLGLSSPFPTNPTAGLGPNRLDVEQISRTLNLRDVPLSRADALECAQRMGQPERIVDTNPALFLHEAISPNATGGGLGNTSAKQQRQL
jgi:hypothetical protein